MTVVLVSPLTVPPTITAIVGGAVTLEHARRAAQHTARAHGLQVAGDAAPVARHRTSNGQAQVTFPTTKAPR